LIVRRDAFIGGYGANEINPNLMFCETSIP